MTDSNLTFDRESAVTFAVNSETRTIKGLAVPYDAVGNNGFGKYRFPKGSLNWDRVKFLTHHDWQQVIGNVTFEDSDEGLLMTAKIARGPRGDEVLSLAEDGVLDGLSIGLSADARFEEDEDGVFACLSATVLEVSGTAIPAFTEAQVRSVAASAAHNRKEPAMGDESKDEAPVAFTKADGDALMAQVQSLTERFADLENIKVPVGPGAPQFEVKEEPIYRFSGTEGAPSGFDFATDLMAAANGDGAAFKRVQDFTAEHLGPQFVDSGDGAAVNQPKYRPDMFLGQAPVPQSPMYDTFHKGTLSNVTPFFWSKLDRANTDVGVHDHTEGVDPSDDDLVTIGPTTVTPIAVSGKVHVTREVADQGGNPTVSGLIWAEFDRSFKIALETKTAALVQAAAGSVTALATPAAGAAGDVVGRAIERGLIGIQFLPDGARFTKAFAHVDLYTVLADFENDEGEKRYPIINPQNRSGVTGAKYSFLDLAGYRMEPGPSLGATSTSASNSYLADPNAVHVWNSGLTRLDKLQETVEGWDLGVFAYFAGVVYDVTGLRKIAYDPTA